MLSADETSRQRVSAFILLSHLLIYFGSLYCKQYGPKSEQADHHSNVCYYGKSSLECILFYYIPDVISRQYFWDKKYWHDKG